MKSPIQSRFPRPGAGSAQVLEGEPTPFKRWSPCTRDSRTGRSSTARSPPTTRWACTTAGAAPIRTCICASAPCTAMNCATRTALTARACGSRSRSRRSWASSPRRHRRLRPGALRAQVQGARAALRRRADRAIHPPGLLDGLERPGACAGWQKADGRSRPGHHRRGPAGSV